MSNPLPADIRRTPRVADLDLRVLSNESGLSISVLPNGCLFAIEDRRADGTIMINQILGTSLGSGFARLYLRTGPEPLIVQAFGPAAKVAFGVAPDRFVWAGETGGIRHETVLSLHGQEGLWLWRVTAANTTAAPVSVDAILVQDVGLASRGFLMNGEAYASQYIDHHIAAHPRFGPVIMSRQNLKQAGGNPWVAHGCLEGAASFATDAKQLFGPAYRETGALDLAWGDLAGVRMQHEVACAILQSRRVELAPGESTTRRFFCLYARDHAEPSGNADLARLDVAEGFAGAFEPRNVALAPPVRNVVINAPAAAVGSMADEAIARAWPERLHEEWRDGRLLSFFVAEPAQGSDGTSSPLPGGRHIVLREKEVLVSRRHGALIRSGRGMLLDETTLCATCWMHGVFAAQLTIGNTSLHKLFSVSRDPYNVTCTSGLRILVDRGSGWQLLTVPSVFDMGLSDCRWIYRLDDRTVTVHAIASGTDPALQWRIAVEGAPCRFLIFGQLVLGERELDHAGRIGVDASRKRFVFRPDPDWLWGQRRPQAAYHLVSATPDAIEAIGGEELLHLEGGPPGGACAAIRTLATTSFSFAVVGSMTDSEAAERLADRYARGVDDAEMTASSAAYWHGVTRGLRVDAATAEAAALDTIIAWFAHDAMIHLTVPHGLEQYTGAAWGTRDVCQGPLEFLLAVEHDSTAKEILRIVFAEQSEVSGDWPQWFMLPPYSNIRDSHSHGDVIVWPLKALADYIEATGDLALLDEPAPWRRPDGSATDSGDPISTHVDRLIATCRQRFIAGTHLMRYGEGDWNDSLQPADPRLRDWMVSSWTVALFFQQLVRYAEVLRRSGRQGQAAELSDLAAAIRADFNRHLVRDGTVAGYAIFDADGRPPELLLHPSDSRTGLGYSLLPMTRSIIGGLFTPEQAAHHLRLIREHLLFPDGVRLMDRPVGYRGGSEKIFRRAESSSFFGREIGLMYVHAHLRYCEALAVLGETDAFLEGLQVVNPIAVGNRIPNALPRQRNAYFSSSDAAFHDRYAAAAHWDDVRTGAVGFEGGWRVYSSGPGMYVSLVIRYVLGFRRFFGERSLRPLAPGAPAAKWSAEFPRQ